MGHGDAAVGRDNRHMDLVRQVGGAAAGDDAGDCSRPEANELGGEPTLLAADLEASVWLLYPRSRRVGSFFTPPIYAQ